MAYCMKCGKEIDEEAIVCIHCGCQTGKPIYQAGGMSVDPNEPANGGLVFLSVLIPLVGIILGITNISNGKKHAGKVYLWTSIIVWLVGIIISGISIGLAVA